MKWRSFLAFGSAVQVATGLKLIDESEDNGVVCYTYLSTYLAAVDVGPAPALPTTRGILPPYFTNRSTSAIPTFTLSEDRESSIIVQDPDSTVALFTSSNAAIPTELPLLTSSDFVIPTEFTDLVSPTVAISSDVATTSSEAEVTGQAVIFFITSDTTNERRRLVKRDVPGGFVNAVSPVDICTDADAFQLADEQLLDNGSPVYYNGEPYKPFGSDGTPPDGAITKKFSNSNGNLVFTSKSLPRTGFCQDDSGQVYITFGSRPTGCDPVLLQVYTVEQCRNGEIPGPDQSPFISSDAAQSPVTTSTDIGGSIVSPEPQESTSTVLAEPTDGSSSSDTSFVVTESQLTVTTDEAAIVTADSSSTDLPSPSSLFTPTLSLTSSEISTIASQSTPLLPTSSTDSTVIISSTDVSPLSESSVQPSSSTIFSTDSTATDLLVEETTTSISTTILIEESETSMQLETTATSGDVTETEETTTTTEEATTTVAITTTGCDSVTALTTVGLLNPTPIFDDSVNQDGGAATVDLPFDVAGSGFSTVYVSTYGVVTVGSSSIDVTYFNSRIPTEGLPPVAICPYWDDSLLLPANSDAIVYEVFNGQHGRQATFEWLVSSGSGGGANHFTATFYEDFPDIFRFSYYTTVDQGLGATLGSQDINSGTSLEISYNTDSSAPDGTSVFFRPSRGIVQTRPFDNTECGKGDPADGSSLFARDP
ncbi:hypothetical protein FSST1_009860 [Fusarium sambucinum]